MSGVYISYPFCAQKCSFCNFASGVFSDALERDYSRALLDEIRAAVWVWTPDTMYLGGGTPSRLDGDTLGAILAAVPGRPWLEATIEAAPGSLDAKKVQVWRDAGINRVSLGVQSFVKAELSATGRRHDAAVVNADCKLLRNHGIDNINIDLIAGLPHQTAASWRESLDWIDALQPPHVSVYLFEVDEDSRLGLEILNNGPRYGATAIPSEDEGAELYELAVERLEQIGIDRYEISNFAQPGRQSHHNLKYWRLDPYRGFGADAHSFDGQRRWGNIESAREYVEHWHKRLPFESERKEAAVDEERLFLGLRLIRGVTPTEQEWSRFGEQFQRAIEAGLLAQDGDSVRLTSRGVLLSNEVFQEFINA